MFTAENRMIPDSAGANPDPRSLPSHRQEIATAAIPAAVIPTLFNLGMGDTDQ